MEVIFWIRFIIGACLIAMGLGIFFVEVFGLFKFKYVLNRMHAAAMGDTLGISSSMVGLMIFSGFNFTTLKMALVILFLWFSSPVASHLLAKLEAATNPDIEEHAELLDIKEVE